MSRVCLMLLAVALALPGCADAQGPTTALDAESWRSDLAYLERQIRTRHVAPFARIPEDSLRAEIARLHAEIPTLPSWAVPVRLAGIAALIGDGHTRVWIWPHQRYVPLQAALYGDTLFITAAPARHGDLAGARITAVGGVPIHDALTLAARLAPQHETAAFARNWGASFLMMGEVTATLGLAASPDSIRYGVVRADGTPDTITLPARATRDTTRDWARAARAVPFTRSRPDPFWYDRVPGSGLVFVQLAQYPDHGRMRAAAVALSRMLADTTVRALLVDLRGNGGGDLTRGQELIRGLTAIVQQRRLPVYVAIGAVTYSAAVATAAQFREALGAQLIGEPTGGRPVGASEAGPFTLPRSRFEGAVSTRIHRFSPDDTPGLFPDIPVARTWADAVAGRDAVLEQVLLRANARQSSVRQALTAPRRVAPPSAGAPAAAM